jgi:hypothetical protein
MVRKGRKEKRVLRAKMVLRVALVPRVRMDQLVLED